MRTLCLFALVLGCGATAPGESWIKLFDGKSLKGWSVHSGKATYVVEKGTILGTAVQTKPVANTFLCTDREFGDFVLEFEVKCDVELNSGVQFRSLIAPQEMEFKATNKEGKEIMRKIPPDRVYGYQVEIGTKQSGNSGNVYDEARRARFLDDFKDRPAARDAFKDGEWNKYRVEAVGDSIKTWVNQVPCADFKDSVTSKGTICLQVHGIPPDRFKPYQVRWRNIRIQEVKR
jgi:hypothetical protein